MEKSIKKFKRSELLELLLEVSRENEQLKERVRELENEIESQSITISEKGTIAEVTIKLSGMLDVIEKASDIYNKNNESTDIEREITIN